MPIPLRTLLVEDSDDDAALLAVVLRRAGYEVAHSRIETASELEESLRRERWDIVLCDHNLPGFDAPSALRLVRSIDPLVPFIIVSGTIGEDVAVEALKEGADDYLLKQNLKRLPAAVERSLRDAENRRRRHQAERANALIMTHSADVICTVDGDLRLLTVSDAVRAVWGWEPDELKGVSVLDLLHPDDRPAALEIAREAMSGSPAQQFENRAIRKDGSVIHMMWSAYWSQADSLGFCIARDITERHRAAQALQTSEARLRSYIENAPLAIVFLDKDGRFSSANRSALELIGCDAAGSGECTLGSIFAEDELPAAQASLEKLRRDGRLEGEFRLLKNGRTPVWILIRGIKTADGDYVLFGADVTARREAEQRLRQREAQYRAVIETSPDGFGLIDRKGRIYEVNDAYVRRSGYSREELLKMSGQDLVYATSPEAFLARLERLGSEGSDLYESMHRTRDGVPWQVEISITCWPEVHDRLFVFIRDVNRRMRSESLRRAQLALSELALYGTPEQLLLSALDAAVLRTESQTGFFYCASKDPTSKPALVWSSASTVEYRASVQAVRPWDVVLQSGEAAATGGMPDPDGDTHLSVPVLRGDRVAGVVGVCRKGRAYDREDIETLSELASAAIDLVERKWAEEALHESQERLSMALVASEMGVWEWDLTNDAVYWSAECYRMAGVTHFPGTFEGFRQFVHEGDRPLLLEASRQAIAAHTPFAAEFRIYHASGKTLWVSTLGRIRYGAGGRPERMVGTVRDVTRRREAADALRRSEERFRSLVETAFDWIWESDAHGTLAYSSDKIRDLLGYEPDEVPGHSLCEFLPEEDAARLRSLLEELRSGARHRATLEHAGRHKDGRRVALETSAQPTLGPAGEFLGFRGMVRDVTERKQAQEQVRRFVSYSPVVIYALAMRNGRFEVAWASDNIQQLAGYTLEQTLVPDWFYDAVHPEDRQRVEDSRPALLRTGRQILEFRLRRQDGAYRWIRDEQRLLRDGGGNPVEVIGSWSDVTDRVLLEEQLRQSQKMESVGRLAGGVAHDFNNLLTVINGYSDMLLASSKPWDPYRPSLEEIKRAGARAAALTHQLLAFSRKQVLKPRPLKLDRVIAELQSMLRRLVGEDIELVVHLDAPSGVINADPHQIEQVIMNLVVNARDAMPHGGRLTIETRCEQDEAGGDTCEQVILRVSDTGSGIDSATRSRIFEPFFTTKEAGKGTGLGLSVVLGIVEQSGGRIEVDSEPGRGTTFRVFQPRTSAPDAAGETRPVIEAGGNETILVVEDQPEVLEFTVRVLADYGYNALRAETAADALAIFEQQHRTIDLVLTDVVMPQLSGWDLAGRLRAIQPDVKVVYMSGYADRDGVCERISDAGATLIQKPFTPHDLAGHIRSVLGPALTSGRILVVDDEAGIRLFLRLVLERAGYRVSEASDGRMALIEAQRKPVDLLLTDIVMPEQEGLETIRMFREQLPGVRIIAMSGRFDTGYLRMAEVLGADGALKKPIEADQLLSKIRQVLGAAR